MIILSRMKVWVRSVAFASVAWALVLVMAAGMHAAFGANVTTSVSTIQTETFEGMIADSRCGAKHSPAISKTAADCTRVCVHAGEQFVLIDGESVYLLEGEQESLKRVA